MDNAGPDEAILKISLAVVILRRHKVVVCRVFTGQRVVSQKPNDASKKHSVRPRVG